MKIQKRRIGEELPSKETAKTKVDLKKKEEIPRKEVTTRSVEKKQKKDAQPSKDPLHGVKLAQILEYLEKTYGWGQMGKKIDIRCFKFDPSIKSSLHFLRRTPWARAKVEEWYAKDHSKSRS